MNYYLDGKKVTPEQLKKEFKEIPWSYDYAREHAYLDIEDAIEQLEDNYES